MTTLQKSIIGKLLQLFKKQAIIEDKSLLPQRYAAKVDSRGLPIRKHGYTGRDGMFNVLPIFDFPNDKSVCISRHKLLELLLSPLFCLSGNDLIDKFKEVNGFDGRDLCEFCQTSSLDELVQEVTASKESSTSVNVPSVQFHPRQPPTPIIGPYSSYPGPYPPYPGPLPIYSHTILPTERHIHPPSPPTTQYLPLDGSQNKQAASQSQFPSSSIKTFIPPPAPDHFPDPDIHPRDIVHVPPIDSQLPRSGIPVRPRFKSKEPKTQVLEKVESYIKSFIDHLSSQGKHLPLTVVETEVKVVIRSQSHIASKDVPYFIEFDKLYKRVKEFIRIFCWHSPITTLFELLRTLNEFEKVKDFAELKMGPLIKHPEVIRMFKVPEDMTSVPEITAYDVHSKLMTFISKNKKGQKPELKEFMEFLAEQFSVSSSLHLCVRISSFPLACSVSCFNIIPLIVLNYVSLA